MGDLTRIGLILGLIGGILAIVDGIFRILSISPVDTSNFGLGVGNSFGGDFIGAIVLIVCGVILVFLYQGKTSVKDNLVLGIVVIVLGVLTNFLALLGGILILVDALL